MKGLRYLHKLGLIYNNLNGSNIFVGRKKFLGLHQRNEDSLYENAGDFDTVFLTKFNKTCKMMACDGSSDNLSGNKKIYQKSRRDDFLDFLIILTYMLDRKILY